MIRFRAIAALAFVAALTGTAGASNDPGAPPPAIQAIMKKLSQGVPPSPAEQKALQDWATKVSGAQPAAADNTASGNADRDDAETDGTKLCQSGGHAIAVHATRDDYLAMARDAVNAYGARLPAQGRNQLNTVLARATNPVWGGDFALLLVAHGSGSAAVVAAATSARKAPGDANTANNLGVALRGMKDYRRAAIALTYARSLIPDSPLIANNLGWLAMSQHDMKSAGALFNAALSKNKTLAASLGGDGLIAECQKKHGEALKFFRASMASGYSRLAARGIDSAEQGLKNSKGGAAADTGSPSQYGPRSGGMPDIADPPMTGSARELAGWDAAKMAGPLQRYIAAISQQTEDTAHQAMSEGTKAKVQPSKSGTPRHIVFERGYEKEVFVLGDIRAMLSREAEKPLDRMAQDYEDYLKRDNCLGCGGEDKKPESCAITRPRIVGLAPGFNAAYRNNWTGVRKWLADLYGFSQPWLAQIQDPATRGNEERALRSSVLASQGAFGQTLLNWQGEATIAYQPWDKDCGTVPPIAVKPGKLKPYKIDPTACQSGETHMNFGLANFNADCEKMVLDFGEGVVGSGEYKFGDDWGSDQVTIFAGAGVSGGLGPLSAGAKTGSYITFQGGEVVDYGNKSSAGINVGFGPMSAGAEGSVRISGVSGLDTNLDSGVTIGAPAPED